MPRCARSRLAPLRAVFGLAVLSGCAEPSSPSPQPVDAEVFLVGDAGALDAAPTLTALTRTIEASRTDRDRIRVLFLGDNIYPAGMPDSSDLALRREKEQILDLQTAVLRNARVRGHFVPGNHDWSQMSPGGLDIVLRQQRYLAGHSEGLATLLPAGGCPGPAVTEVGRTVRIVLLDTETWLRRESFGPPTDCAAASRQGVIDSLRRVLALNDRRALVAAHHPVESGGPHGGFVPRGSSQADEPASEDLGSAPYTALRNDLARAFAGAPPLVYASGHDHSLQVLRSASGTNLLVSGSAHEVTPVQRLPNASFAKPVKGFMRLTFLADSSVHVTVFEVAPNGTITEGRPHLLPPP